MLLYKIDPNTNWLLTSKCKQHEFLFADLNDPLNRASARGTAYFSKA